MLAIEATGSVMAHRCHHVEVELISAGVDVA